MTLEEFVLALNTYVSHFPASATSWGRTPKQRPSRAAAC